MQYIACEQKSKQHRGRKRYTEKLKMGITQEEYEGQLTLRLEDFQAAGITEESWFPTGYTNCKNR